MPSLSVKDPTSGLKHLSSNFKRAKSFAASTLTEACMDRFIMRTDLSNYLMDDIKLNIPLLDYQIVRFKEPSAFCIPDL